MDLMIFSGIGFITFLAGLLSLKREIRLFKNVVTTTATVVKYNEYEDINRLTMYTMVAEYKLIDGRIIQAPEQAGCTRRKYSIGTELQIGYSQEKPELFTVKNDYSRKAAMVGMCIVGLAMFIFGVLYELG
ncbi:DUF3592 domain-containing protein [Sporomusa malonica]|uniref:DUF3592 domain-containing protein n=1 Tax=Sporomusa malonica TaxID=112901 RepID=A0A1W2ESX3_9FIRM|nr:DUF3592 domain-containing protein [Sporomusa malonica]SMD12797.1 Protein of unknown function [Sporomusa malonica]